MEKTRIYPLASLLALGLLFSFFACQSACNEKKSVFFKKLHNNSEVSQRFHIEFESTGMEIKPAGEDVDNPNAGHHHLLIDSALGYVPEGVIIPATKKSIHFGKGEREATLELTPGKHKLTLQMGDGLHRSYGKKLSKTITIKVVGAAK